MKFLVQITFFIGLSANVAMAAEGQATKKVLPQDQDESRQTASSHLESGSDSVRFSGSSFRCFAANEQAYRDAGKGEPSPELRDQWVDMCAGTPVGN